MATIKSGSMKKKKRGPKITCECGICAKCYFRKQQRKRRKGLLALAALGKAK